MRRAIKSDLLLLLCIVDCGCIIHFYSNVRTAVITIVTLQKIFDSSALRRVSDSTSFAEQNNVIVVPIFFVLHFLHSRLQFSDTNKCRLSSRPRRRKTESQTCVTAFASLFSISFYHWIVMQLSFEYSCIRLIFPRDIFLRNRHIRFSIGEIPLLGHFLDCQGSLQSQRTQPHLPYEFRHLSKPMDISSLKFKAILEINEEIAGGSEVFLEATWSFCSQKLALRAEINDALYKLFRYKMSRSE